MPDPKLFAGLKRNVLHDATALVFQFVEFRINGIVENVGLQQVDAFFRCVNSNRLFEFAKKIVNKDRQTSAVVHVRVRYEDVPNGATLFVLEGDADAPSIDWHAAIDYETSETLRGV